MRFSYTGTTETPLLRLKVKEVGTQSKRLNIIQYTRSCNKMDIKV